MVKKLPTKDDIREQLERETRRYLDDGGKVDEVPQGASGTDPLKARNFQASSLFNHMGRLEKCFFFKWLANQLYAQWQPLVIKTGRNGNAR